VSATECIGRSSSVSAASRQVLIQYRYAYSLDRFGSAFDSQDSLTTSTPVPPPAPGSLEASIYSTGVFTSLKTRSSRLFVIETSCSSRMSAMRWTNHRLAAAAAAAAAADVRSNCRIQQHRVLTDEGRHNAVSSALHCYYCDYQYCSLLGQGVEPFVYVREGRVTNQ
jgi:hypothetical protein